MSGTAAAGRSGIFSDRAQLPADDEPVDERAYSKLRWRCRRGLLENDLLIERFFLRHGTRLTVRQAGALAELMELGDNDLLDLLLGRKALEEIDASLDRTVMNELLNLLKGSS